MFMGNQQMYTKCKLSAFGMEKKKVMRSSNKSSKDDDSDANSKSIQPDFTHQQKRKRPAWSFPKKRRKKRNS